MSTTIATSLIINVPAIALALVMVMLLLWQDSRSRANLIFGGFMVMVVIWLAGGLVARIAAYISSEPNFFVDAGLHTLEIGFIGICVSLCLFAISLTGGYQRLYVPLVIFGIVYQIMLIFPQLDYTIRPDGTLLHNYNGPTAIVGTYFLIVTSIIIWQERRKVRERSLLAGILIFCVGMYLDLFSPEIRQRQIGADICAIATLIMSYANLRAQIIEPLRGRATQLQAVRDVGLAITSRLTLKDVLSTIAGQVVEILQANGAAIFLKQGNTLELAAVHNMPIAFIGQRLALGDGLAGKVATSRQPQQVENYTRDWSGLPDMPYAKQAFGAVIAAPLIFAGEVMGVLVVVHELQGRRFDREDMRMIELLGPQAALAITNSRLFERQRGLTGELQAAKYQFETLLTSTENPVIALNRRFEVIFANPAALTLLDHRSLTGRSIREVAPAAIMPPNPYNALRQLQRSHSYTYELTIHERNYLCHVGLLGRSRPQGFVVVLNDVTQLKELDALKNQMIRWTSHDLKNPLAAAIATIDNYQDDFSDNLTDDMRDDLNKVMIQLERMDRIIKGILDMERIQSGKVKYETCYVDQIVAMSIRELSDQAGQKGVTLTTHIPDDLPSLSADRHHLTQAITNLIENAVKFTPAGGTVDMSAEFIEGCIILHVADTGIGIPVEAQSKIFERFYRAERPGMERISGTGLGLSLVKSVVDAHRGRIWLESEVNKGTTIHLALPVRREGRS